jgi:hypothetical protein
MSDEQGQEPFSFMSNTITSGKEMAREFFERRNGQQEAPKPNDPPANVPDYSKDIDSLRGQLSESARTAAEMRGQLQQMERQNTQLQQWIQNDVSRQQQRPQEQMPSLESQIEDPALLAAMNAIDARQEARLKGVVQNIAQHNFQQSYTREVQSLNQAIKQVREEFPEWARVVSDQQISEWAKPYLADPNRHGGVDWTNEFRMAARAVEEPVLRTENAELKKKLAQYEKQSERNRQEQKQNLNKVPGVNSRGGSSEDDSKSVGERVLGDYKKAHGRRAIMPWDQFGTAVVRGVLAKHSG